VFVTQVPMPHPIYASQYWVCIVNHGEASWNSVRDLLAEAHEFAARKYANQQTRQASREG
jgi:predicted DNA-binding protein (MmcQ/YjbR family)